MKRSIIPYGIFALMLSGTGFILPVHASTVVQEVLQRKGTIEVRGTVTGSDGPIIGATIMVHGTKTATVTDVNGQFTIQVPVGSRLDITCVGYMPTSVVCKTSKPLQVEMKEDATTLQGVQVIAYGTTKKVTVTGAISSVNQEDLLKAPVANMGNALAGKVTGLSSIQMSGEPGADSPTLFIRGVGSLSTGLSSPLILVDGVERSFFQLDPNEVDNITVLKVHLPLPCSACVVPMVSSWLLPSVEARGRQRFLSLLPLRYSSLHACQSMRIAMDGRRHTTGHSCTMAFPKTS